MPYLSAGSIVGYATDDTTYGNFNAATAWLPPLSYNVIEKQPAIDLETFGRPGAAGLFREEHVRERVIFDGRVEHYMHYQAGGMHYVLLHCMGAVSSTSDGAPETHTYTLGDKPTLGMSVTVNRGGDKSEKAAGGRVTSFEIRHNNGTDSDGVARLRYDAIWVASENGEESLVSSTYTPITRKVLSSQLTGFTWNSVDDKADLLDFTVAVNRNTRRAPAMGQRTTQDPIQDGPHEVTATARFRRSASSHYAGLRADTQSDIVIAYSGTSNDDMTITARNAVIDSVSVDTQAGRNEVVETVVWKCYGDATDSPLTIAITNDATNPAVN